MGYGGRIALDQKIVKMRHLIKVPYIERAVLKSANVYNIYLLIIVHRPYSYRIAERFLYNRDAFSVPDIAVYNGERVVAP